MNAINKLTVKSALVCLGMCLFISCSESRDKRNNGDTSDNISTTTGNLDLKEEVKDRVEEMKEDMIETDKEKDADRVTRAYMMNLYKIMASEKAVTKATVADVKKLAQTMKKDHTKISADIQTLATKKNITLPADITNEEKRKIDELNEKMGIDFDKEYTKQMKEKHEDAIKDMEKTMEKAEDTDIKQWAGNTIPQLRAHLTQIEKTWEKIKDMKEKEQAHASK